MYPHIGKFYRKTTNFSGDATKRVASPSYNLLRDNVECDIQPTTTETKQVLGFSFNEEVYTVYMDIFYTGDMTLNDLFVINGKAYNFLSWLEFNNGGDTDHIEAVVKRLPTNPVGVV